MFDPRNNLSNEVSAQLIEHFSEKVFRTIIPRNVRLAEAPSYGKPALHYDRESRGALAYLALAGEMIRREEGDYRFLGSDADADAKTPNVNRIGTGDRGLLAEDAYASLAGIRPSAWPRASTTIAS